MKVKCEDFNARETQLKLGAKSFDNNSEKLNCDYEPRKKLKNKIKRINKSYEENKSEDSMVSNKSSWSSGNNTNNSFQGTQNINIKLCYFINQDKRMIDINFSEDKTIKDFISFSLNIINEQLICENIQLDKTNISNYSIKLINKKTELNDKPQTPDLNSSFSNININENQFYLVWNDKCKSNINKYNRMNNNHLIRGIINNNRKQRNYVDDSDANLNKVNKYIKNLQQNNNDKENCFVF